MIVNIETTTTPIPGREFEYETVAVFRHKRDSNDVQFSNELMKFTNEMYRKCVVPPKQKINWKGFKVQVLIEADEKRYDNKYFYLQPDGSYSASPHNSYQTSERMRRSLRKGVILGLAPKNHQSYIFWRATECPFPDGIVFDCCYQSHFILRGLTSKDWPKVENIIRTMGPVGLLIDCIADEWEA